MSIATEPTQAERQAPRPSQTAQERAFFAKALASGQVFRLCEPNDVDVDRLAEGGALFRAPVLFITQATANELQNPSYSAPEVTGCTISLAGQVCDEVASVSARDITDLGDAQLQLLLKLQKDIAKIERDAVTLPHLARMGAARAVNEALGVALLAYFRCAPDMLQADVASLIDEKRWESSVWMERDRANLSLMDNLTGKEVFNIWDDNFYQAIEDGFLSSPRSPRPRDADWHQPALDYARQSGAMDTLSLARQTFEPASEGVEPVRDRQRG